MSFPECRMSILRIWRHQMTYIKGSRHNKWRGFHKSWRQNHCEVGNNYEVTSDITGKHRNRPLSFRSEKFELIFPESAIYSVNKWYHVTIQTKIWRRDYRADIDHSKRERWQRYRSVRGPCFWVVTFWIDILWFRVRSCTLFIEPTTYGTGSGSGSVSRLYITYLSNMKILFFAIQ